MGRFRDAVEHLLALVARERRAERDVVECAQAHEQLAALAEASITPAVTPRAPLSPDEIAGMTPDELTAAVLERCDEPTADPSSVSLFYRQQAAHALGAYRPGDHTLADALLAYTDAEARAIGDSVLAILRDRFGDTPESAPVLERLELRYRAEVIDPTTALGASWLRPPADARRVHEAWAREAA